MDDLDSYGARLVGRSPAVFGVSVATFVLSTVFVGLRMLSRAWIVKRVSVDDHLMLLAWILALGLTFCCCYSAVWGLGRHEEEVPDSWEATLRQSNYAFTIIYQPALMAVKSSILAFYLTLPTSRRIFKWACIAILFIVNAGGLSLTLVTVFQCRPIWAAYAAVPPPTATCTDILTIYLSSIPLNIITDLAIIFLPFPVLTGMRLPKKTKIILIITFSFGIFVAAVDVVRVAYLQSASEVRLGEIHAQTQSNGRTQDRTDFSWYASFSFMWSVVEVNTGIMVACVPGLKPIFARFLPHLLKDPGEVTSKSLSDSPFNPDAIPDVHMDDLPTAPADVHRRDFGSVDNTAGTYGDVEVDVDGEGNGDGEGAMGMMEFLSVGAELNRTSTALTNTTRHTRPESAKNFFDFVNVGGKKSMVHMTNRESVFPISMVTVLFFIWGFEYGLLDVLNSAFQSVADMSPGQGTAMHSAYFAGYAIGPLTVGRLVLTRWGFKACYTVGLAIYGCGTLIFWPSAVLTSFAAFIITNFVVGFGLSLLEVAANPFITLCGPPEYGEIRLNLSQAVQAIGSIVAPLIADKAFFRELSAPSLINAQWAYLGISLSAVLLAVCYHYVPLPEATDEELEDAAERIDGANYATFGGKCIIWYTLGLGAFSIFCYVGAQEVLGTTFNLYIEALAPMYNGPNFQAIGHTTFAVSRFLAAGLGFWIRPRHLLLIFYTGCIIFTALAMNYTGSTGTALYIMSYFMEGPLFPLIFAQSLRGMGKHTKTASVIMTAAISGGAIFTPISNRIAYGDQRVAYSHIVGVATLAAGTLFPIALNAIRPMRCQVDPIYDPASPDRRPSSSSSLRKSRVFNLLFAEKKKRQDSGAGGEHQERRSSVEPVLNTHGLS